MYALQLFIVKLADAYTTILLVYVLMSWIPYGASKWVEDIRSVLASISEPYLSLFRRIIPPLGMVDFSPVVAIIVLQLAESLILAIL